MADIRQAALEIVPVFGDDRVDPLQEGLHLLGQGRQLVRQDGAEALEVADRGRHLLAVRRNQEADVGAGGFEVVEQAANGRAEIAARRHVAGKLLQRLAELVEAGQGLVERHRRLPFEQRVRAEGLAVRRAGHQLDVFVAQNAGVGDARRGAYGQGHGLVELQGDPRPAAFETEALDLADGDAGHPHGCLLVQPGDGVEDHVDGSAGLTEEIQAVHFENQVAEHGEADEYEGADFQGLRHDASSLGPRTRPPTWGRGLFLPGTDEFSGHPCCETRLRSLPPKCVRGAAWRCDRRCGRRFADRG